MTDSACDLAAVGMFAGQHALAELTGVSADLLDDERYLVQVLDAALAEAGATVLQIVSRHFVPQGVTVLALLSESHASMHTYPEHGSLFIDVFTCGSTAKPAVAVRFLADSLLAGGVRTDIVHRGAAVPPRLEGPELS